MPYSLSYSKSSLKNLSKIPLGPKQLILKKLELLKQNPYKENNNIKKLNGLDGFRLRVGNYRVIYQIEDKKFVILIIEIDVRGGVYK